MKDKFIAFLESLKGKGHDALLESVKNGFTACYENTDTTTKYTCPKCGQLEADTGNKMCPSCMGKTEGAY